MINKQQCGTIIQSEQILTYFVRLEKHHLQIHIRAMLQSVRSINAGFPDSSAGKESSCNAGDLGSIPGLGRSPGEGKGYPLQYPGLENSMDCIVYGVAKSWTRLSNFHLLTHCINAQDTWMQGKGDRAAVKPQDSNYWVENSFGFFVRVYEKNLKEFFG